MSKKIMDLSDRLEVIRDDPFQVHFWECTPTEYQRFLWNPRAFLRQIGILLPRSCRIETTIENHDWIGERSDKLESQDGAIICNMGGGDVSGSVYRIMSFGRPPAKLKKAKKRVGSRR